MHHITVDGPEFGMAGEHAAKIMAYRDNGCGTAWSHVQQTKQLLTRRLCRGFESRQGVRVGFALIGGDSLIENRGIRHEIRQQTFEEPVPARAGKLLVGGQDLMGKGNSRRFSLEMKQPLGHRHDIFLAPAGCPFKDLQSSRGKGKDDVSP